MPNPLQASLADIPDLSPAEGLTVKEVKERLGRSKEFAREWLQERIERGEWECAGKGEREDSTGRRYRPLVYRKKGVE